MGSLVGLFSLLFVLGVSAVGPGDKAPALDGTIWVKGSTPAFEEHYAVLAFWSTRCQACESSLPVLNGLVKRYGERIAVAGLSNDPLGEIYSWVAEMGEGPEYSVGKVPPEVYAEYMEGKGEVPYAFLVNQGGVVVWEGHPMDVEDALARAFSGTLDVGLIRQLGDLEKVLKESFETHDPDKIADAADAVLALDPAHERAIRIRGAVAKRRKDPGAFRDIYEGIPVQGLSGEKAARLAWELVTQQDFSYRNMDLALALMEHAVKKEPGNGSVAVGYARVHYALGNVEQAVAWQGKAVKMDPAEESFSKVLDYYLQIKALRESAAVKVQ